MQKPLDNRSRIGRVRVLGSQSMFDRGFAVGPGYLAAGLALLSLTAFVVTAWVLTDVRREEVIVARLTEHLPATDLAVAKELSGDLSLQRTLSLLMVLNSVATGIAIAFVVRGYMSSQRSLQDVRVLSTDILASMDAAVVTTDLQGLITSFNPTSQPILGIDERCLGQRLNYLDQQHDPLVHICASVLEQSTPIRDQDYSIDREGHRLTLRASCTLLRNRRGEELGAVVHVRNVTEKTLIEDRLRRMERYMGIGSLAAGLQHEIKNPLSGLSLHVQLLSEKLQETRHDAESMQILEVLQAEVRRIGQVLDQFRSYVSLTKIGRTPVDVALMIEKLIRFLRPQAESEGIKIRFELPGEMVGLIEADPIGLEQVLLNLALNAMAAMPDGGVLTFRLVKAGAQLQIDVADTGKGIPESIRSQIFDPYFTTKNDGLGMGLAICDKVVRQHEGTLDFTSGAGGTVFRITLPSPQA